MEKYQDTILSTSGDVVASASVQVLTYPGGVAATIYSDNGVTQATNPLTTDANGRFSFYAADGHYSLSITKAGLATVTVTDILLTELPITTTKGDLFVASAAATLARLAVGSDAQRLVADSTQATGLKYVSDTTDYAVTTKGDLLVGTANQTVARKGVGAGGTVPMARAADTTGIAYVAALNKAIYGFTYANNGTDSIDIAAGGAMDSTGAYWITGSALTKSITTTWVVGNAQGMLDTGAVGNSDYYLWAIVRSDTGVVDYLASLSSTAPTMPASYDFKRLIGWFKRVGGNNVAFHAYETEGGGLEMNWDSPTLDINLSNTLTTSRRTDAVKVPLNFSVLANLNIELYDAAAAFQAWVYCPDQTDLAPSNSAAPLANASAATAGTARNLYTLWVRTSATGTIAARADLATVDLYAVATVGFRWARRN